MTASTAHSTSDITSRGVQEEGAHGHSGAPPSRKEQFALGLFVVLPFLAMLAAVPVAWGGWLGWSDVVIAAALYVATALGITVGYHRLFTHKSFKPNRGVKIALALAGSLAIEGPVTRWVADHRKHHKFSDRDGDPHSPWRYGETIGALAKGFAYAHMGWMFNADQTPQRQYAPDLLKDKDIVRIGRAFPWLVATSLLIAPVLGGLVTWSWQGALTAFFWGTLVRIFLLHHVTWSINSICHTIGESPFRTRDRSGNVWWLAIPSMGESWHNLHHADPTCARHGVLRAQLDISARTIWLFEKLGWAHDVRWPVASRLESKRA
ncbi:MAG TPA: acyl-CoA desaturase [Nocardioidaceae bacterium]|nr:acyl-CoA desaturase [Nocardioidaceae bacterium]